MAEQPKCPECHHLMSRHVRGGCAASVGRGRCYCRYAGLVADDLGLPTASEMREARIMELEELVTRQQVQIYALRAREAALAEVPCPLCKDRAGFPDVTMVGLPATKLQPGRREWCQACNGERLVTRQRACLIEVLMRWPVSTTGTKVTRFFYPEDRQLQERIERALGLRI